MVKGEVKVAYQGMPGAYSEKATRQLLGSSANVVAVGYPSFEEAFLAVQRDEADFGVLPIENSLGGSIHANYDLLLKFGLHIVGEYDLRVEHSLLALPGVQKSDIKTVISHPQALAQCAHTIDSMGAKPRAEYDTAGSAKMLADNQWKDTAAVASDLAAEYYGLQVLQRNVEDDAGNFTRFLLLSKKEDLGLDAKKDTEFKTSLVFSFVDSNEKGQLYKALSAFSLRDIDMSKIESRPWGHTAEQQYQDTVESEDFSLSAESVRRKYSYLFYVDLIGHQTDENVINALRHLREFCKFVRVLGSYPTKGKLLGEVRKTLEAVGAYQANPITASPAIAPQDHKSVRLNIGIYGFGNFGQFLAKAMAKSHEVRATSRTDYSTVAAQLGCKYYSSSTHLEQFFDGLDVLVLGVSILSFEGVLSKIPKHLLENLVIVDVLSVKTHPKQILLKDLPQSASILCTHPMFGPESGKYSWRGLPMMYEKVRILSGEHNQVMDNFLRIFETEQCRMLEMTCESHDEYAASSQFLTHLTGRILSVQGVKNTPIDTRGFKNLVRLVEDTCKDSFDLFQGLYKFNPNSEQQIQKFRESLGEVTTKLGSQQASTSSIRADAPLTEKYPQNPLLGKIAASKTVVIHGMAKQLEAEGKQVWSLCVGEPDFAPSERVLKAGMSAMEQGKVKYTDVKGTAELRTLIAQYLETCKGLKYDPLTEILVSNGAKQTVYQALLTITRPGEQVLIPAPYWVSYPEMVKLTGGEPVILQTKLSEGYLIDPVELEKTLVANPRIKSLMLCNPSNPAGTVHSPAQLESIAAVLRKPQFRHILVIADEIYEQLVYQDEGEAKREHQSFATLPGMYERTLTVNGFSKSHAMPGLRIGYLAAPKYFVQVCTKLQGQLTSCANSVGQAAAVEAMKYEMECVSQNQERMTETLAIMDAKRKYIVKRLQAIPQLEFAYPTSAFYVFLDLASYFEGKQGVTADKSEVVKDADDYCEYLLRHYHVALVPGSAFGVKNGLRISYACSMETIEHALDGLEQSLGALTFTAVSGSAVTSSVVAPASNGGAVVARAPFREDAPLTEKYPQNPLLGKIAASKTVVIHGMAKQLEAEGKQVWSLCVGEPDFAPSERVLKAGMSAMEQGKVKYTDVKGTAELRTLIAQYLETCKGLKYDPLTEILVSNGAKQTVYQALLTITRPGEQVLIPAPYWVSYPEMVKLTGGEPVILQTKLSEGYLIDPVELEKALVANPRIKSLMLCNPSNPAGTVHSPAQLESIAAVLRKPQFRHILVIADEIYEQLVYQDEGEAKREHQSFATLPGMYERTLTVNGFSKSHAMPGLRIGYLAAPKYFVQVCTKLQGQLTSCANSVGQAAAVEAMKYEMECVSQNQERMTETLAIMDAKRKYIVKRLQAIPQLEFAYPTSAFYVFLDLASYFEGKQGVTADKSEVVKDADDYCEYLLRHYHVALVPGSAFGVKNGLRISYACSMETIEHALDGLEQSLGALTFTAVSGSAVTSSVVAPASNGGAVVARAPFREDAPLTEKYPQNPLLGKIAASKTVVIHGMAKQLEAEGKQVWSLCVGEPDFAPSERVLKAGMSAMEQGKVKYTDVKGTAELRTLIAQYLETCKGLKYDPLTEILVSNGAKQTVYQALLTITRPGEQVLIPAPYWVSYPEMVKLTGGEPVILQTKLSEGYLIDPVELEKALVANPRIKSLMLCNPSNPAGTVHSPAQLESIAAVLRKPQFRHILVIADEIYEQLVYQDEGEAKREHQSFATLPGMYERTLTVNGFSKSHAMPGLRIGYLAAPKYFVQVCTKLQGQLTSCANSVGQAAAVEAMKYEMECVSQNQERMTETLAIMDAKRKYIVKRLQAIPQLEFAYPTSAFYVFLDLASYFEGKQGVTADKSEVVKDADDYCEYLLRHYHVALVPGSAFGVKNGLRISYACSMETIEHALDGLEQSLGALTFTAVSGSAVTSSVVAPASNGGAVVARAPFREDAPLTEKYPQNPLLGKIAASKTVVIHGMAKQLEAEGKQVWSLCVGEPDFAPSERVLKAGMSAMEQGKVKYTDVKGTAELRTLIAQYLETCKGLKYDPLTEILVSNGAKQTVYQALLTITRPGEQVLIPAPYWVSYPEMVKLTGGEPVILQTKLSEGYLIDPVELEKALVANPRIKSLMLCNPSNPAGTVHSPAQLESIAAVLRKPQFRHILVIADEIYEQLVYQDEGEAKREHQSFATLPGMYERTLTVNGFSKSHAMPGLRIGYLAAPKYFVQVCTKLQGQLTSCANSVGQAAAVEAMKYEMECVSQNQERMTETLAIMDAKRKYIVKRLQAIPQLEFAYPTSAFYVFLDLASYFEGKQGVTADKSEVVKDADDYCEYLLRHYHVALVPGSAFGVKNGLRISYACSMETIEHALDGLEQSLGALTFTAVSGSAVTSSVVAPASNGGAVVARAPFREDAPLTEKYPQNPLLGKIAASKTVVIHGMAKQLEAEGKQVWSLCVGEPDFAPSERVLKAGMSAMEQGKVKYTDVKGTAELRTLIAQYLETCKGLKYDPLTEILVSNGAKQTVYQALLTITRPGEQVLIPAPYWVSYPEMVKLTGGEPVILQTKLSEGYLIDPVELEKALVANPRIKSLMLCNPSNPAGTVHSPAQLESIAAVLRKPQFRHILVIADEIYEQLVYQDEGEAKREHQSFATLPGMYERTLTVNGFSKSHAMPGLRIGYLAAPKYFVQVCTKLQGQLTSCANSVGQAAAVEAMKYEMECVSQNQERMTETLAIMDAKRKYIVKRLQAIPQLEFAYPTSAFYVFLDLASYFEGKQGVTADKSEVVKDADDYCEYLLRHYHVALVPGSAFGVKNGLRISYACSMETIEHALDGLEQSLGALTFTAVSGSAVTSSVVAPASNGGAVVARAPFREDAPLTEKYPQNPLLGKIAASKTVVIHGMAKQLEAEGKQVWSLCVGEPDFAPSERVLKAGMSAMEQGKVKYTDVKGTAELRTLIAQYLETCKGLKYDPLTEILVSNGAKQTVYQALLTITRPGEQVLIPAPYWVSYPEMVKLTGGEPVILQTKLSEGYLIDPVELEKALVANPRIKSLMLCNPSNPAGTVHSPAQLESIAAVLRKPQFRHILVIADEIYEQLVYQDEGEAKREHQSFATLPGMYERTLTVNGFSKSHAMPGLRIGYLAAPKYFVQVCTKLQGQLTSCANSVGQAAAVEAMKYEMECVSQNQERMTETLAIMDAKRKYIVKRLQAIPQLEFAYPTSAFYVFLDLASYFEGKQGVTADKSEVVKDADDYCEYLLRHYHVALVPGSAFGVKNGLRISYACSMETIEHALDGLEQSLGALTFTAVSGSAVTSSVVAPASNGGAVVARAPFREDAPLTEKYPQNPLLGKIAASKTVVIHGMAKQLEAEGKQVWSLCVGEPDFAPSERVLKAGMSAMEQGKVKYTDVKGTAELRTLIAQYLETCKGLKYDPLTEILVSNGAKQTVYQALLTITRPGEQVLIPAPYWVSYPEMVKLTGGEPVILQTKLSEGYLIDPVELEKALVANPRIKSLMLCNPSNPAGTVHSPAQLESIAAVLRKPQFRHILVIADEIYEQLVYQDEGEAKREHQSFATLPGMYERTLTVNGFSKSHAMPGLRIGYLAAPKYFVQVCTKLQGQLTSCANSVGQAAAVEAMKYEMECVSQNQERMTETLAIMDAKRKYIVKRLQAIPQLEFAYPTSAFYVFLDLASYFEGKQGVTADKSEVVKDADDYCEYLLRHYHVALVPGSAFGVKNGLRISYACSMETIEHALDGLEQSLGALHFE